MRRIPTVRIRSLLSLLFSLMSAQPINVVDLFAGCGGLTQGFRQFIPDGAERSPFRSVAAVEFDVAAATTYAANCADDGDEPDIWAADIAGWHPAEHLTGDVEVILGGPPCQGFSGLGKEDRDDPRNKLWRQYMRVVKAIKPKVFVIENVDRFLKSPEYTELRAATTDSAGAELRDYDLRTDVLNAADYGVPQRRRRVIAIATHRDLKAIDHPARTHRKPGPEHQALQREDGLFEIDSEGCEPWVPVDRVLDLRQASRAATATELPDRETTDVNGKPIAGTYLTRELHIGRNPTAMSLARYAAIKPGGNRHDLRGEYRTIDGESVYLSTEAWDRHNTGAGDVMGRLRRGEPAVTIRTEFYKPEKGRYLHPTKDRPLTHLEAALIQGFPMDYKWCGSKVQIARQIGNAVPIGLAEAIAKVIHKRLRSDG